MARRVVSLPGKISNYEFIALGAIGCVYQLSARIAIKFTLEPGAEELTKENSMFDLFEKHAPCPHVVQSFLRIPGANFLAFMSGGSLYIRLRSRQVRDGPFGKVLRVEKTEPVELVGRWPGELTSAVVWLEGLGYVHGDLRSNNLLLDGNDRLKLADFDCVGKVGEPSGGNAPPWARVLGDDFETADGVGGQRGSFGTNGPRTEQFAIGSNLYCMVYGFEPYEDRDDQGPVIVDLLQDMKFPELRGGRLDGIIDRCWRGHYAQLEDLLEEVEGPDGAALAGEAFSRKHIEDCRKECQALVDDGLLGALVTSIALRRPG